MFDGEKTTKTILVVDDEQTITELLHIALEDEGYEVICAHDGQDAMQKVEEEHPDLIICDLLMPHMNGEQFYCALKQSPDYHTIPVVLMSGSQNMHVARKHAFDGFLAKPFDVETLFRKIQLVAPYAGGVGDHRAW
jgi:twitching motility two-component system response regulator PilG